MRRGFPKEEGILELRSEKEELGRRRRKVRRKN
jgi:hypothetical protein